MLQEEAGGGVGGWRKQAEQVVLETTPRSADIQTPEGAQWLCGRTFVSITHKQLAQLMTRK